MIKTRIAEIVEESGYNNKSELARTLGLHRNGVNGLLNNDQIFNIRLETIEKLCKTLNVLPNDLFVILNEDGTEWKPR